jgi:predicted dienelactone hydrolase
MIKKLLKIALKIILFGILAVVLGFAAFIAVLNVSRNQPLQLPAPTGSYSVGRSIFDWVDQNRTDPLADTPNLKRELAIWIWYPAQPDASGKTAPYLPAAWAQARDKDQGNGILIESELTKIKTSSFTDAPLADQQSSYPVLVMQPGMGPAIPDYTVLAENLASHGYIVVGVNPTYTSNLVTFPDGRVMLRSEKGTIPDSAGPAAADQLANSIMGVWSQDVIFVMDHLQSLNADPSSPFYQRLDLNQIGVFGHSFGGATAIAVCQKDARCKAGADLDGTPFSAEAQSSIPRPFLFMTEDYSAGCDQNCLAIRQMAGHGQPGNVYNISVNGARHFNFSDLPLRQVPAVRPLFQAAGYTGSIDPARGEQIANAYLLAFFDQSLKAIDTPLLKGPSPDYPEVQFGK